MCWAVITRSLQKLIRTNLLVQGQDYFNFVVTVGAQIQLALKQGLLSSLELAADFLTANTLSRFTFPGLFQRISLGLQRLVAQLIRELTDLVQHSVSLIVFAIPLLHIVVGLLVLEPFENLLVLHSDLHQFSFPFLSVQALFNRRKNMMRIRHLIVSIRGMNLGEHCVGVGLAHKSRVLQDISHFFKKNPVFAFDLSVAF